jgi:hypothetical protein
MDFLNDVEQAAVQAFYENEGMRESVKKAMLATIYACSAMKPGQPTTDMDFTKNPVLAAIVNNLKDSDELLGANLRGLAQGLSYLEMAFAKLSEVKKVEPKVSKPNKAR